MRNSASHSGRGYRLLLLESSRLVRECLAARFSAAGIEVTSSDWAGALTAARRSRPDVVLLSVRLPNRRAVDVARRIVRRRRACRIVFLDDAPRPAALAAVLKEPVHGYWSKQSGFADLLDALDRVADGRWAFDPAVQGCLEWSNEGPRFRYWPEGTALAKLSARERDVLAVLGEGVSVKQCALRFDLAPNTIDNHKSRIMKKVGLRKNTELLWLAIHEGLVEV